MKTLMDTRLTNLLHKANMSLTKTASSINEVDDDTDSNQLSIQDAVVRILAIEAILNGEAGDLPFIHSSKITNDLTVPTAPATDTVAGATEVWEMRKKLYELLDALANFDGNADPNDYLTNLNQVMAWANANTDTLAAMEPATPTAAGFMSALQAGKLASIQEEANKTVVTTDINSTSGTEAAAASITNQLKTMIEQQALSQVTAGEIDNPTAITDARKFSPNDILDIIKKHAVTLLDASKFERTIYIPGEVLVQEFGTKLSVPDGDWNGKVHTSSSNSSGTTIVKLTHTDATEVTLTHSVIAQEISNVTLKGGTWTIAVTQANPVIAQDLTLLFSLIKQ